jgi:hypothetical protein
MSPQEELLEQVRKSIETALPAIQVDVFRRYVDESEKAKSELNALKQEYKSTCDKNKALNDEIGVLRGLKNDAETLKRGLAELALDKQRFDIDKKLKDKDVECAKEKVELVRSVVGDVFRNMETRRNIFGTVPCQHEYTDCNGHSQKHTSQEPSAVTETETKA